MSESCALWKSRTSEDTIPSTCREICQEEWEMARLLPTEWHDEIVGELVSDDTLPAGIILDRYDGAQRAIGTLLVDAVTDKLVAIQVVPFVCKAGN